jgi:hypothetical protein
MKCKICNQKDIILYPYKHRLCYECYVHLPNCESCKNQVYKYNVSNDNITLYIMFIVIQILFYILATY